jgi:hypothetical protein
LKKYLAIFFICLSGLSATLLVKPGPDDPVVIPAGIQRTGNADSGYNYIVTGDYVNSGLPLFLYRLGIGRDKLNQLNREGLNASVRYDFNVVTASNDETIVVPNCLQCHAQVFEDSLIIGLGNAQADFTSARNFDSEIAEGLLETYMKVNTKKGEAAKEFIQVGKVISGKMYTEVKGVNPADRLTSLLITHRDKNTL